MALTILFDVQVGFMGMTAIAILIGIMIGQNIDFIIVSMCTSTIAVYNSKELRKEVNSFLQCFH